MSFWQESRVDQILLHLLTYTPCEFSKGDRYTKNCDKETLNYNNWCLCPVIQCKEMWWDWEQAEIYFTNMVRLKCVPDQWNMPIRPRRMFTESKKESTRSTLQLSTSPASRWSMNKTGQDGHQSASSVGVSLVLQEGQRTEREGEPEWKWEGCSV